MSNIPFFIGALLPTFLISRLLLYILKRWSATYKKVIFANAISLIICSLIAGMGLANGGAFAPIVALPLYAASQAFWLAFDLVRIKRKPISS